MKKQNHVFETAHPPEASAVKEPEEETVKHSLQPNLPPPEESAAGPIQSQAESGAPPRPHAERRSHTPLRPNQPQRKEPGWGFFWFCSPALVQMADVLGWLLRVCQEELASAAALCSFTLSLMKMYGDI